MLYIECLSETLQAAKKLYVQGIIDGLTLHSWMKNGVSYIGQHRPDGTGDFILKDEIIKVISEHGVEL